MKFFKNIFSVVNILIAALLLHGVPAFAGGGDFMRQTGKIYVVVTVILVIFAGLTFYLWRLDRKLTNLEHQIKDSDEWTH